MLTDALDCGIRELDFWDMTIAEVSRAIESANRLTKLQAQETASHNYILANLIVKGIGILLGDKATMPTLKEVYPDLFNDILKEQEAKIEEQKINLSVLRFKQFAQSYNAKYESTEVLET